MTRCLPTIANALALSNRIIVDNEAAVEPLIDLLLGLTSAEGDAKYLAIRSAVLKNLYCHTEDFSKHFREYTGEDVDRSIIQTNASPS